MKKTYISPSVRIAAIMSHQLICASYKGVDGTGKMMSEVSNEETSDYLSRRGSSWDNEE